ncbi:gp53-like domain-containing protein [Pseudomonas laurylsulfatiphila]|uniref:gp53-like domain-containing protein n=1 Tax=Pseudomonas laurylsulfatiphila TaxID=2011015 RepID=UPI003D1A2021
MANPVVLLSTGDVIGPNSSVDGTMVLFDGTSGKKIKGNNAVVTAQGLALLDDVDAAANRATIGLNLVNNTSDINKPVSTAQQTALNLKANKGANSDITSITGLTTALSVAQGGTGVTTLAALEAAIGTTNVDNTSDMNKPVSTAQQTEINTKADKGANSDITSITGLTTALSVLQGGTGVTTLAALKSALALNLVNNTSDVSKPVSTAQQTAIDAKANKGANSDITSITGLTTALSVAQGGTGVTTLAALEVAIGTTNVDNTSDVNKPVSTAQQTALDLKANLASPNLTGIPLAPTAAVGVITTQIASCEFVKKSGTTLGVLLNCNTTTTLTTTACGNLVQLFGTNTGQTIQLAAASAARVGDVVTINNYTDNPWAIIRQGSDVINTGGGGAFTSISLAAGESLILVAITGAWLLIGGSGANKYAGGFAASLAANGYQKLPSGLIIQMGSITLAGNQAITFPTVFPTACRSVVTTPATASNLNVCCNVAFITASNFSAIPTYANAVAAMAINWIAIGH